MSKTNLYVIIARDAPTAVIFRRGPSKQCLLVKWDLRNDSFEQGQWLKGRIYEYDCDLSPSGEFLLYFAANYRFKTGPGTWTAISRPPFLTALAMWPQGNTWGGGGLFESENSVLLNHGPTEFDLAEGFKLRKNLKVHIPHKGNPIIHEARLRRDGWTPKKIPRVKIQALEKKITVNYRDYILRKTHGPTQKSDLTSYLNHEILDEEGQCLLTLPRTSWADWDKDNSLLFAQQGKLFRLAWAKEQIFDRSKAKELIDLSDLKFQAVKAPEKALKW